MASFNEDGLKKKLDDLNMSTQSIQTLSLWLIHHKKHAPTVVSVWLRELVKASDNRKLNFMYLANDVIQNSKKKGPEYNKAFGAKLEKAFDHLGTLVLDEKSTRGIKRLLTVWAERGLFDLDLLKLYKNALEKNTSEAKENEDIPLRKESKSKYRPKKKKDVKKNKHKSHDLFGDESPVVVKKRRASREVNSPEAAADSYNVDITNKSFSAEIANFTVSPQGSPTPRDPPEPEELIQTLQELENNAATVDATIREKIASLPIEVSDVNMLSKLQDVAAGQRLAGEVDDALGMLEAYNKRLQEEMEGRRHLARMLHDFITHQKDKLRHTEKTLEEHRQKLVMVKNVRSELKAHLQNLPDISQLPNLRGNGLAPLPSAGDLFT